MPRISLPPSNVALVDDDGKPTLPFSQWLSYADDRMAALGIGVGKRKSLPSEAVTNGVRAILPFSEWLSYVDRSLSLYGPSTTKRKPLPPSNLAILGVDLKASIPFAAWLMYADRMLA